MNWFDDQLRSRQNADNIRLEASIDGIARAVMGKKLLAALDKTEQAKSVAEEILKYYHLHSVELSENERLKTLEEQLEYYLRPHGVMYRSVELATEYGSSHLRSGDEYTQCRKFMFDNKKAFWFYGLAIGITTEVTHMLLVFITNINDVVTAFLIVKSCALPMILCNGISVMLSLLVVMHMGREKIRRPRQRRTYYCL